MKRWVGRRRRKKHNMLFFFQLLPNQMNLHSEQKGHVGMSPEIIGS